VKLICKYIVLVCKKSGYDTGDTSRELCAAKAENNRSSEFFHPSFDTSCCKEGKGTCRLH
jgi:hypothetical protein